MLRYYVLMSSVNKDILRCLDTHTYPGMSKKKLQIDIMKIYLRI